MTLWTQPQIEQRISHLTEESKGTAGRLAEMLRADPECDVTSQVALLRRISRGITEAKAAMERFGIMELEPQPIEFQPIHG